MPTLSSYSTCVLPNGKVVGYAHLRDEAGVVTRYGWVADSMPADVAAEILSQDQQGTLEPMGIVEEIEQ